MRSAARCASILLALAAFEAGAGSIAVRDDTGRSVELKAPAKRIVTLAPFLTELAYSAGAGSQLVGASAYSDYPPQARKLPQVGSAVGPEIESLMALGPDLVLAWQDSIRREDVERLRNLGIVVFVARARRLDDAARLVEVVATLAGHDASKPAADYRARLQRLRSTYAGRKPVRVFVEIWHRPLTTIAGTHWIGEALALCGAENVFADLDPVAPVVSWEELYRRNPRGVLGTGAVDGENAFVANWTERASLPAVRDGRLTYLDADTLARPTLRLGEGVERICEAVDAWR